MFFLQCVSQLSLCTADLVREFFLSVCNHSVHVSLYTDNLFFTSWVGIVRSFLDDES